MRGWPHAVNSVARYRGAYRLPSPFTLGHFFTLKLKKDIMKIELKNIKYAAFQSHETNCYAATIYIDGVRAGTVENNGHGGCDNIHPHSIEQRINAWAAPLDAETIFAKLLNTALQERDLKRAMSRRILFRREGKLMETHAHSAAELKARLEQGDLAVKLRAEVILNLLPFPDASAIYRARA